MVQGPDLTPMPTPRPASAAVAPCRCCRLLLLVFCQGDARQALDLLHHELSRASDYGAESFTYHLALLHGAIKHSEWCAPA